ncbi:MAG: DUF1684 domain-containing protein [Flavobacteriales bacterium]|nr:DUF1684 domain-containing protein [Flavobacteriales bacterium]
MRLVLMVLLGTAPLLASAQTDLWADSLQAYWDRINTEYRDPDHTPLLPEDRAHFTELERYRPDERFRVTATFKKRSGKPFGMPTTTERRPQYEAVGILHFALLGHKERLTVYRNIELSKRPEYANYLFIPFTDPTNGEATYGGGRYLELAGPLGKQVEIDFNRAYNPYCAYGGKFSCPIPPPGNHLQVPVEAGVKAFAH